MDRDFRNQSDAQPQSLEHSIARKHRLVFSAVSLALAGLLGAHATSFMGSFNATPAPALLDLPADSNRSPTTQRRRVILIIVDGLGRDYTSQLGLDEVRAARCELRTPYPSYSRPAYVSLSTGAPPDLSGVHVNAHRGPARLESIFDVTARAGLEVVGYTDEVDWWTDLFPGVWRDFDSRETTFRRHVREALDGGPGLVLLHTVKVDSAGHREGAESVAYKEEVRAAGRWIRDLLSRVDPERHTVLITADHGHLARGGHGGPESEVRRVPLIALGSGIRRGTCQARLIDLPSTIARLLGVGIPRHSEGTPLLELLAPRAPNPDGASTQARRLQDTLNQLAAQGSIRRRPLQPVGLMLAVIVWLMALVGSARGLRRSERRRGLLMTGMLYPSLAVTLYLIAEPALSFSAVWSREPWLARMGVGLTLVWFAAAFARRALLRRRPSLMARWPDIVFALLPWSVACGAHGGMWGGPVLGDPHAAFGLLVGDLIGIVGLGAGAVAVWLTGDRRPGSHGPGDRSDPAPEPSPAA